MPRKDLLNITIKHDFYVNELLKGDLLYEPSAATALWMKNHRLLYRSDNSSIRVLYTPNGDDTNGIIPLTDERLTFMAFLDKGLSTQFLNITDLDISPTNQYTGGKLVYITNADDVSVPTLVYKMLDGTATSIFTFTASGSNNEVAQLTVTKDGVDVPIGKDANGNPINTPLNIEADDEGRFSQTIDLSATGKGHYKFVLDTSPDQYELNLYIDDVVNRRRPFALIEIDFKAGAGPVLPPASEIDYDFMFNRKETYWRYLLVNKSGIDLTDFTLLIDDKSGDPTAGAPYNTYGFTGPTSEGTFDGFEAVSFISDDLIPFFETPKFKLELQKRDALDTGAVPIALIENLPNPARDTTVLKKKAPALATDPINLAEIYLNI